VIRGGCWNNTAQNCRSANRNRNTPGNRNNNLGFRLVLLPAQQVKADADLLTRMKSRPRFQAGQKQYTIPELVGGIG
jgi:Sulfatase-modifying factor enzyme 1